ncbi:MAG: hypothetical protein H0X65_20015 [Gemmatimonadetes bacterium]|nr:hypothetical protein [Gemmatimonadota bacterium]
MNNTIETPTLENTMLEVTTQGDSITSVGITFLATSQLDSRRQAFLRDVLLWIDPLASTDGVLPRLNSGVTRRVDQISRASAVRVGKATVRAGNVGGDAVISIEVD